METCENLLAPTGESLDDAKSSLSPKPSSKLISTATPLSIESRPHRKVVRIDSRPPENFSTHANGNSNSPLLQQQRQHETEFLPRHHGESRFVKRHVSESSTSATDRSPFSGGAGDSHKFSCMSQKSTQSTTTNGLSLYEEDATTMPTLAAYLRSFTIPGPLDKNAQNSGAKKATKLGTLLGVYLPTIQHILGVQMFLRLLWIVGIGGITHSFIMVFVCCLCTLLTCISISAIATNGVIESGGAYFMISRNLGAEFGTAVGILYYLANTVATSMYLIGGVEILLMYIAPDLPQFGSGEGHHGSGDQTAMFNNFRLYGTGLLLVVIFVVALGVKFVQCFAPVSLFCVVISILSVYIGGFVATPQNSPKICMVGDRLVKPNLFIGFNDTHHHWCNKSEQGPLYAAYCVGNGTRECLDFLSSEVKLTAGIPGFFGNLFKENARAIYLETGEVAPAKKALPGVEVNQDITTDFFIILAIFFPSVTGIFTGANMSGDLKDPQKSLPKGTIAAQLTTSFVYLSFVLVFGGSIHGALLRDKYGDSLNNKMIVAELAWPNQWVLLIGSFTSTFGAALQCLCSAPRLLQSIARDDVIPFLRTFSDVSSRNEPVKALVITSLIAEVGILIGSIDDVAPVVDFFFLMCYCFVNVVCVLQTLLNAPNWRPRFKFYHWSISLLGALLCLFIMFATYWYYAVVVMVLCASIYKYVEFKGAKKEWGDGISGLALSTAQYSLLKVENRKYQHPKNWRPQLLVMIKDGENQWNSNQKLLQIAGQLKAGQGLTIVASLILGDMAQAEDRDRAEELDERLQAAVKQAKVRGFTKVIVCQTLGESVSTLIQSIGIGGLKPNTVMVGWPYHWKKSFGDRNEHSTFLDAIHRAATADLCLLIPKGLMDFPDQDERLTGTVDVWWIIHDGGLLVVLPFLLMQHKVWRQCKLRIFAVAQLNDNSIKMKEDLQRWVYQLRIDASVDVVELADSTISAYTYERTLLMEERHRLAMDLHLSRQDILHEPQLVADRHRSRVGLSMLGLDEHHRPNYSRTISSIEPPQRLNSSALLSAAGGAFKGINGASVFGKRSCASALPVAAAGSRARFFHGTPPATPKISEIIAPFVTDASNVAKQSSPMPKMTKVDEVATPDEKTAEEKRDDDGQVSSTSTSLSDTTTPSLKKPRGKVSDVHVQVNVESPSSVNVSDLTTEQFTFTPEEIIARKAPKKFSASKLSPFDVPLKPDGDASATDASAATEKTEKTAGSASQQEVYARLDQRKVRKMHTAVKLNAAIREQSSQADLVVLNLPRPPRGPQGLTNYMDYLEALTEGLQRVLLVRGSGKEVITIYS